MDVLLDALLEVDVYVGDLINASYEANSQSSSKSVSSIKSAAGLGAGEEHAQRRWI